MLAAWPAPIFRTRASPPTRAAGIGLDAAVRPHHRVFPVRCPGVDVLTDLVARVRALAHPVSRHRRKAGVLINVIRDGKERSRPRFSGHLSWDDEF